MESKVNKINMISRFTLAFIFLYHGLVPKIIWFSSIEKELILAHGITISPYLFSTISGVLEVILACTIMIYNRSLIPIYLAASILIALIIDVATVMPALLVGAFNPISTNIAALALCYIIYLSQPRKSMMVAD